MKHDVRKYIEEHAGKYLLVNSLSRRVRDLQSGYKPLVPHSGRDLTDVAIDEFKQNKIEVTTLSGEDEAEEEKE